MIEIVIEPLRLFFKILDVGVDVVFAPRAINPAPVERIFEALAKSAGLFRDSIKQFRDFLIADAVRLAQHLADNLWSGAAQRQRKAKAEQKHSFVHSSFPPCSWPESKLYGLIFCPVPCRLSPVTGYYHA